MSDYDPRTTEDAAAVEASNDWPAVVEGPVPSVPTRSPTDLCGRAAGPIEFAPANQNAPLTEDEAASGCQLFDQLPRVIRDAVDEWAIKLMAQPWRFRREIMGHFARVFADQFEANIPDMTEEAYEGLREIGFTCLLERMDDGRPVADLHQARIYLESVHDHHKHAARAFLGHSAPRQLALN